MDIDPAPITAWFALFIAIGTTVSLITAALVWSNRRFEKRVTGLITETTKQIQPNSNGGKSLSDLHKKFDAMDEKVDRLERHYDHVLAVEEDARQLWHQRYLADQRRIKREWTAVFIAIRKMMHLPPDEQVQVWDDITDSYINGTIVDKHPDERTNEDE